MTYDQPPVINEALRTHVGNYYRIEDEGAAPFVGNIQDLHVSESVLEKTIQELTNMGRGYDRVYLQISDFDERTNSRRSVIRNYGLKTRDDIFGYLVSEAIEDEGLKEDFVVVSTIDKLGGIERALSLYQNIPEEELEKEKEKYLASRRRLEEYGIGEKIKETLSSLPDEVHEEIIINDFRNIAFDHALTNFNVERIANILDKYNSSRGEDYPELVVLAGGGNHDSEYAVQALKDLSKNTKVHNINEVSGAIKLGSGDEQIAFQFASNCYNSNTFTNEYLPGDYKISQFQHLLDNTLVPWVSLYGSEIDEEVVRSNSVEYQRLTDFGKDETLLDFMIYHQELGTNAGGYEEITTPEMDMNLGVYLHHRDFIKKGKDSLRRTYSGHFHRGLEGHIDEELGQIRNRFESVIIGKDWYKKLDVSRDGEVEYDMEQVIGRAEKIFVDLIENYNAQIAANDSSKEELKEAA